jgi:methionyl aminopeptidase
MIKLPNKKTEEEIKLYKEYGPLFGEMLKELRDKILTKEINNSREIFDYLDASSSPILPSRARIEFCNEAKLELTSTIKEWDYCFSRQKNDYQEEFGYPFCLSINDTIGHGIPDLELEDPYTFKDTDIISIDMGLSRTEYSFHKSNSLYFDAAFTVCRDPQKQSFVNAPLDTIKLLSRHKNIKTTKDISQIIYYVPDDYGYDIVASIAGHGIGHSLHEPPKIYNIPIKKNNYQLFEGMVFCIEPVYVEKEKNDSKVKIVDAYIDNKDNWSIKTVNGKSSTHWETMFLVENNKLVDLLKISEW